MNVSNITHELQGSPLELVRRIEYWGISTLHFKCTDVATFSTPFQVQVTKNNLVSFVKSAKMLSKGLNENAIKIPRCGHRLRQEVHLFLSYLNSSILHLISILNITLYLSSFPAHC